MTLEYRVTQALELPGEAFNDEGLARVVVTGGSYGGEWILSAISVHAPADEAVPSGSIATVPARQRPDLAMEAAQAWIEEECQRLGLELVSSEPCNAHFGPLERLFTMGMLFHVKRPQ